MHWYTFKNTLGRPVEQLAVCLANKQKSAVEVKVQQLCKVSAKRLRIFKVPVRYRLNAASGGWSYGRDLVSLSWKGKHPFWNGYICMSAYWTYTVLNKTVTKCNLTWRCCYQDTWKFLLGIHSRNSKFLMRNYYAQIADKFERYNS